MNKRKMRETSITILIPAWNEEPVVLNTVKFLRKLKLPFDYSEVIFIAGGDDATYELCSRLDLENFSKVLVLRQEPGDYKSGALIKAYNRSKGRIISLIDADTLVSPNLMIKIPRALNKYDAVMSNYYPILEKGFWYDYYTINKLIKTRDNANLASLFGAATISMKRTTIEEIGFENFFTEKTTAGVDHYMSIVLKENGKTLGLVKDSIVFTPRPNKLIDFIKDQERWFSAFFKLYITTPRIILSSLFLSILSVFFPILLFITNFQKISKVQEKKKLKYFLVLFLVEYIMDIIKIIVFIKHLAGQTRDLGHFKGSRY